MKKVLKIIGIILVVIIAIVLIVLKIAGSRPVAPTDYQQSVQTGGEIEAKYMANGSYEVSMREDAVLQEFGKYVVYYPSHLKQVMRNIPLSFYAMVAVRQSPNILR